MRKKLFWILMAILFLAFATEDWAFYRPGTKKLTSLNEAINQSQNQVLGSRLSAEKLRKIRELIDQNTTQGQASSDGEIYVTQSLSELTAILKEQKVELLSISPEEIRQEKLYVVSPFQIELRCGYHQFGRLLDAIDKSSDFIVIREFKLSMVQDQTLVQLSVDVYLFQRDSKA